jgi:hypothetical protein
MFEWSSRKAVVMGYNGALRAGAVVYIERLLVMIVALPPFQRL